MGLGIQGPAQHVSVNIAERPMASCLTVQVNMKLETYQVTDTFLQIIYLQGIHFTYFIMVVGFPDLFTQF